MASLNPLKLASFALVISGIVSTLGGAQMVIEEVVKGAEQKCSAEGEVCFPEKGIFCCEGLGCTNPLIWPPVAGHCYVVPQCGKEGAICYPDGVECCEGYKCIIPLVSSSLSFPWKPKGNCVKWGN